MGKLSTLLFYWFTGPAPCRGGRAFSRSFVLAIGSKEPQEAVAGGEGGAQLAQMRRAGGYITLGHALTQRIKGELLS